MTSFHSLLPLFLAMLGLGLKADAQLMSEYTQKTGKLNTLERKVTTSKEEIKAELKALSVEKNDEKAKEQFAQIQKKHADYEIAVRDYNALRQDLKYKFPKKHDTTVRRYLPLREQTLEEIENEVGIDSVLTRVKQKLDRAYRPFTQDDQEKVEATKTQKADSGEKERLRLER